MGDKLSLIRNGAYYCFFNLQLVNSVLSPKEEIKIKKGKDSWNMLGSDKNQLLGNNSGMAEKENSSPK